MYICMDRRNKAIRASRIVPVTGSQRLQDPVWNRAGVVLNMLEDPFGIDLRLIMNRLRVYLYWDRCGAWAPPYNTKNEEGGLHPTLFLVL